MAEHTEDGADAETAADAHRDDVAYLSEQIDLTAADLTGWSVETLSDGRYAVSGRCPVCRGDAYGPALNRADAPDGEASKRAARPVQRMVPTSCRCGRGHGKDGASDCGRSFFVPVRP